EVVFSLPLGEYLGLDRKDVFGRHCSIPMARDRLCLESASRVSVPPQHPGMSSDEAILSVFRFHAFAIGSHAAATASRTQPRRWWWLTTALDPRCLERWLLVRKTRQEGGRKSRRSGT